MLRRNALLFSVILFCVGLLLANNPVEMYLIGFINHSFHLHLDLYFRSQGLFYCGCLLITLSVIGCFFFFLEKNRLTQRQFYFLSSATIAVFYFFFLWKDAVNIPITDDYRFLDFLTQYVGKATFAERWQLLTEPINECREVIPKLYFVFVLKVFGTINFKWLLLVNGCMLLVICTLLNFFYDFKTKLFSLAFLFMILQFQSFDLAYWTTSGLCHYLIFMFAMLCTKAIAAEWRYSFFIALICSVFAAFTFGNGLLLLPLCCGLFIYKRKYKEAIFFAFIVIVICVIYFIAWTYPKSHFELNIPGILIYACGFLGSSLQFMYYLYLPVLTGFLILCVFIYATYKKYYRHNLAVWILLLFIILSAFIGGPFRLDMSPLQSRYGLYSVVAIILCIIVITEMLVKQRATNDGSISYLTSLVSHLVLFFAVCYSLLSGIMFYPEAPVRKAKLENFINDWKNGRPLTYDAPVIFINGEKYLEEAKRAGIWNDE